jgi:hypothetical protein
MRRGTAGMNRTRDRPLELTTPRSDVRIRSPDHSRVDLMSRCPCRPVWRKPRASQIDSGPSEILSRKDYEALVRGE